MKKLIYILIGIFTFSIGFWLFQLRPNVTEINSNPKDETTEEMLSPASFCKILQNAKLYKSKTVRVKALIALGGYYDVISSAQIVDYKNGCASDDSIEVSDALQNETNFIEISNALFNSKQPMTDGWSIVEVEFTGELEKPNNAATENKIVFKATKIRQVSPIRFFTPDEITFLNKKLSLY